MKHMKIWRRKEKSLPSFSHFLGWNKLWLKDSFYLLQQQQDFSSAWICVTWDVTQWDYRVRVLNPGFGEASDWNQVTVRVLHLCLHVCKETECYYDKDTIQPQMHHMETQQPLILMGCYRGFFSHNNYTILVPASNTLGLDRFAVIFFFPTMEIKKII